MPIGKESNHNTIPQHDPRKKKEVETVISMQRKQKRSGEKISHRRTAKSFTRGAAGLILGPAAIFLLAIAYTNGIDPQAILSTININDQFAM